MNVADFMNGNLANLMNLTNVEMGLILVEGSILLSSLIVVIYLKRINARLARKTRPLLNSNSLKEWVHESDAICQSLSKNLEEKKEIAKQLIAQLDKKIQNLQNLLEDINERGSLSHDGRKKDLDVQIFHLAEAGHDIPDIARRLQVSKGEVQLTLDLKRLHQ